MSLYNFDTLVIFIALAVFQYYLFKMFDKWRAHGPNDYFWEKSITAAVSTALITTYVWTLIVGVTFTWLEILAIFFAITLLDLVRWGSPEEDQQKGS